MGRNYKEGKERNLYILTLGFLLLYAQPKVLSIFINQTILYLKTFKASSVTLI